MAKPTSTSPLNNPSHSTLHNFHVNVKMYGATGDGATDDTSAIASAITAAGTGGIVFFPAGTYKANIIVPSTGFLTFQGAGVDQTSIRPASGAAFAFTTGSPEFVSIKGLTIYGGTNGINFASAGQVLSTVIEDVKLIACATAINFAGEVLNLSLNRVLFLENSGHVINHDNVHGINTIHFDRCWFQGSTQITYINFPVTSSNQVLGVLFSKCVFEGPCNTNSTASIVLGQVNHITFINCHWADFAGAFTAPLIKTVANANGIPTELNFINCDMYNDDGPIFHVVAGAATAGNWVISGSTIWSPNESPFDLDSVLKTLIIQGGTMPVAQSVGWGTSSVQQIGVTVANAHVPLEMYAGANGKVLSVSAGGLLESRAGNQNALVNTAANWSMKGVQNAAEPSLLVDAAGTTKPSIVARAAAAHTGTIQEWQNSGGTPLTSVTATGALDLPEQTEPAAPAANTGRLFVKDTGGKSQLLIRFPSGVSQIIATEP